MNIEKFFLRDGDSLSFTREQASSFAKAEAGDFNPIHNTDARRFCVPGDLLFAVVLQLAGLYRSMSFEFLQLVTDAHSLKLVHSDDKFHLQDANGRQYLEVTVAGDKLESTEVTRDLTRAYIEFSGITFPYLLVDLLQEHQVMINPSRPLVMYRSMAFELEEFPGHNLTLDYSGGSLRADGKKAEVELPFGIRSGDRLIGKGSKNMVLSGLRAYDVAVMDTLVADYNAIKEQFSTGS